MTEAFLAVGLRLAYANAATLIHGNFDAALVIDPGVSAAFGPTGVLELAQAGFGAWPGNEIASAHRHSCAHQLQHSGPAGLSGKLPR